MTSDFDKQRDAAIQEYLNPPGQGRAFGGGLATPADITDAGGKPTGERLRLRKLIDSPGAEYMIPADPEQAHRRFRPRRGGGLGVEEVFETVEESHE